MNAPSFVRTLALQRDNCPGVEAPDLTTDRCQRSAKQWLLGESLLHVLAISVLALSCNSPSAPEMDVELRVTGPGRVEMEHVWYATGMLVNDSAIAVQCDIPITLTVRGVPGTELQVSGGILSVYDAFDRGDLWWRAILSASELRDLYPDGLSPNEPETVTWTVWDDLPFYVTFEFEGTTGTTKAKGRAGVACAPVMRPWTGTWVLTGIDAELPGVAWNGMMIQSDTLYFEPNVTFRSKWCEISETATTCHSDILPYQIINESEGSVRHHPKPIPNVIWRNEHLMVFSQGGWKPWYFERIDAP